MIEQYDLPTLRNVRLRTLEDSVKVALATQAGVLRAVTTRLAEKGPTCIQPGDIYVFVEGGEIVRWTDGFRQSSASRTRQQFLCYIIPSTHSRPKMCRKRCKHELPTADGGTETWHVVAYDYDDETAYGQDLRFVEDADEFHSALASAYQLPTPPPEEALHRTTVPTGCPPWRGPQYDSPLSLSRDATKCILPSSAPTTLSRLQDSCISTVVSGETTILWKHFDRLPDLPQPSISMLVGLSSVDRHSRQRMDDDMLFRLK